ncbi:flavin monoamine oxidase family protein [Desulfococcus multivorans]|uniref:Amine oxidase n=1 Tax=Desulfococcus multivorans DSM 2059 TaxID=1121405 RepID=S7V3P3_DESML|nr:FAD-dependent oxidoreductase [Desulfococcus multivorans]AOY60372.1 flavin containing amine oxidase [Desulfococcus multivorans]AQV02472.2 amine oxidase [Desulfococcus multivorans]EPR41154.1 amine oxidase [Desulfococcus multivorans DSM 2059]SJZ59889.1 monoamine oxidase [Desulfococcus multivorans DSM 2059]
MMSVETVDTLIVGGGLSGIYAAWLLSRKNTSFVVLEARERIGGRILCPGYQGFFSDLGPSWYWPAIHPKITHLIETLGLNSYPQFETGLGRFQRSDGAVQTVRGYPMEPPSRRLFGGMHSLIRKLREGIPENAVRCNHPVCDIEKTVGGILVSVGELEKPPWARFRANQLILALPPRLAAATILFTPELSHQLTQAMLKIGTWMAGQAKFSAIYDEPFWRQTGLSGQAFSERGPLGEIHDGSNHDKGPFGLTGFVGIPAAQRNQTATLTDAIMAQLAVIFGAQAARPTAFFYQDWARERFTATTFDQPPMYTHPQYHVPAGRSAIWDGTCHFAGTETADVQGGYLEGALGAAERAVMNILG